MNSTTSSFHARIFQIATLASLRLYAARGAGL